MKKSSKYFAKQQFKFDGIHMQNMHKVMCERAGSLKVMFLILK